MNKKNWAGFSVNSSLFRLVSLFLAILFLITLASAFAVTKSHSEDSPLRIMPGEKGEAWIELQNVIGGEDVQVEIKVLRGKELLTDGIEKEFLLEAGEIGRKVIIEAEMPSSARVGERKEIEISIITKNENEGMLAFSSEINTVIPVVAGKASEEVENVPNAPAQVEKPLTKSYNNLLILGAAIIGILIVVKVMMIINKRRNNN